MPNLKLAGGVVAAAIEEWGPRLVAIPAGYAIGAWIGTLVAFIAGLDREGRTDLRDKIGVAGGTVGLTVWLMTSVLMN